jgi:hypothetical protein
MGDPLTKALELFAAARRERQRARTAQQMREADRAVRLALVAVERAREEVAKAGRRK